MIDYIIMGIVSILMVLVLIRHVKKRKKDSSCGSKCAGCPFNCYSKNIKQIK